MATDATARSELTGAEAIAACLMVEHEVTGTVVTIDLDRSEVGLCACGATGHVRLISRQVSEAARDLAEGLARRLEIDADVLDRSLAVGQTACARAMARYVRSGNDTECLELENDASLSCSRLESAFDDTLGKAIDELLEVAHVLLESAAMSMDEATLGLGGKMAGVLCMRRIREHEGSVFGVPDARFPQNPGREDLGGVAERGAIYAAEGRIRAGALVGHDVSLSLCKLDKDGAAYETIISLARATDSFEDLAKGVAVGPVLIERDLPAVLIDGKKLIHRLTPDEVAHLLWHVGDGSGVKPVDGAFSAVMLSVVLDQDVAALQIDMVSSAAPQRYEAQQVGIEPIHKGLVGPVAPTRVRIQLKNEGM